jgi:hypothetical protein
MSPEARRHFETKVLPKIEDLAYQDQVDEQFHALDFISQPVDIVTFCQDNYYLGRILRGNLYTKLLDDLQDLFAGHYVEVVLAGGIGYGKTTFTYVAIAYDLYCVSCLRNPAHAFGLIPGTSLAFVNVSVNLLLAKRILFKGIANLFRQSPYFCQKFPFDRRIESELRFPKGVVAYPVATTEQSLLGEGVFSAAFDEINFYAVVERSKHMPEGGTYDQAQMLYNRISRRLKSRMNQRGRMPGHLYMMSSARYPNDFTERKKLDALSGDKSIFVRDYTAWETKPASSLMPTRFKVEVGDQAKRSRVLEGHEDNVNWERVIEVPDDYREEFERDPDAAVRDFAGIPVLAIRPFIVRREKIVDMFKAGVAVGAKHPFTKLEVNLHDDELERLIPENLVYEDVELMGVRGPEKVKKLFAKFGRRFVHVDLAKTQDACGFACGLIVGEKEVTRGVGKDKHTELKPIIRIELCLRIVAPKNDEIPIAKVRGIIYQLADLGCEFEMISYDSWGSVESVQTLAAETFSADTYSVDKDSTAYEQLKVALYDDRIICYEIPVLRRELGSLEKNEKTGKIDHPPSGSKDLSDALAGVIHHAEEYYVVGASRWKNVDGISVLSMGLEDDPEERKERLWDKIRRGQPLTESEIAEL